MQLSSVDDAEAPPYSVENIASNVEAAILPMKVAAHSRSTAPPGSEVDAGIDLQSRATVEVNMAIPTSLTIAADMGVGPELSGFIISGPFFLSFVMLLPARKLMQSWNQVVIRRVILLSAVVYLAQAIVYALVANPPDFVRLGASSRFGVILVSRLALGVAEGAFMLSYMMALKVTPRIEFSTFCIFNNVMLCAGAGGGPILSSLLCKLFRAEGIRQEAAFPMWSVAAAWCLVIGVMWLLMPLDLGQLVARKQAADELGEQTGDIESNAEPEVALRHSRSTTKQDALRHIVVAASLLFGFQRAVVVSAVEAATAMIFEWKFELQRDTVGLLVGLVFVLGTPVMVIGERMSGVSAVNKTMGLVVVGFLAMFLLFDVRALVGVHSGVAPILLADFLIFPTGYMANGLVDGLANWHAVPNTWASQENYLILSVLFQNMGGRSCGPPMARYLLNSLGQNAYACSQLGFAGVACGTVLKLRWAAQQLSA